MAGDACRTPAKRLPKLLRAAARRRDHHPHRVVALGDRAVATTAALSDFLSGETTPAIVTGTALREGRIGFVFSRQRRAMAWHGSAPVPG
jgi:acyl transferase domain-containing protein